MFGRQCSVPLHFDELPPDIEGWINITSPGQPAGGFWDEFGRSRLRKGQANRSSGNDSSPTRRPSVSSRAGTGDGRHKVLEPCDRIQRDQHAALDEDDVLSLACDNSERAASVCIRRELARACDALSSVIDGSDDERLEDSASAPLIRLANARQIIEREARRVVCRCKLSTSHENELRHVLRPALHRRSQANDSVVAYEEDLDASTDTASRSSASSGHLPTLLNDYFECAQEKNLLRERISERKGELCERLNTETSSTLTASIRRYEVEAVEILSLQSALSDAMNKTAKQRALCLAHGLDPEDFRYRRTSDASV